MEIGHFYVSMMQWLSLSLNVHVRIPALVVDMQSTHLFILLFGMVNKLGLGKSWEGKL